MAIEGYGPNEIATIEYAPSEAVVYRLHADATVGGGERVAPPIVDGKEP
jgi:hypothetical protein